MSKNSIEKKNIRLVNVQPKPILNDISNEKINSSNKNDNFFFCKNIFETYQNCMYSRDDIILCNQALDLYNYCINK